MGQPIRFYLDEHMSHALAMALRVRRIDVLMVSECGRSSLSDEDQLRFATSQCRVLVSHDADFLPLVADFKFRGEVFSGVAFCPARKYAHDVGKLLQILVTLHGVYDASEMINQIEYL